MGPQDPTAPLVVASLGGGGFFWVRLVPTLALGQAAGDPTWSWTRVAREWLLQQDPLGRDPWRRREERAAQVGRCNQIPSAQCVLGFGRELSPLCSGHSFPSVLVNNSVSHP